MTSLWCQSNNCFPPKEKFQSKLLEFMLFINDFDHKIQDKSDSDSYRLYYQHLHITVSRENIPTHEHQIKEYHSDQLISLGPSPAVKPSICVLSLSGHFCKSAAHRCPLLAGGTQSSFILFPVFCSYSPFFISVTHKKKNKHMGSVSSAEGPRNIYTFRILFHLNKKGHTTYIFIFTPSVSTEQSGLQGRTLVLKVWTLMFQLALTKPSYTFTISTTLKNCLLFAIIKVISLINRNILTKVLKCYFPRSLGFKMYNVARSKKYIF